MVRLALFVTLPVILGVTAAGYIGNRRGAAALWTVLAVTIALAVILWGLQTASAPFTQRFVAPTAVYLPPLILGGVVLSALGRSRWTVKTVSLVAIGAGASNILLAQFFFVLGCVGGLWECP